MMILRIRRYAILATLTIVCIFYAILVWDKSRYCGWEQRYGMKEEKLISDSKIRCVINGDTKRWVQCLKLNNDVFLPFDKFIRRHFDVTGRFVKGES